MRPRKFVIVLLTLAAVGAIGGYVVLNRADPTLLLEQAIKQAAHRLPFEVESVTVKKSWRELLRGRLSVLAITLKWGPWRVHLQGPAEIRRDEKDSTFLAEYDPEATIEPVSQPGKKSQPLPLHLWIESNRTLTRLHSFGFTSQADRWGWKLFGIELEKLVAIAQWRNDRLDNQLKLGILRYENQLNGNPAFEVKDLSVSQGTQLQLEPLTIGKDTTLEVTAKEADVLWGETFFSLPLESLPIRLDAQLDPAGPSGDFQLSIASLRMSGALEGGEGIPRSASLTWNLPSLDLAAASQEVERIAPQWAPWIQKAGIRTGKLQFQGKAKTGFDKNTASLPGVDGRLRLSNVALKPGGMPLLIQGLQADLPFSTRTGLQGTVEAGRVAYQKLESSLGKTPVSFKPTSKDYHSFEIRIGDDKPLPLRLGEIPLQAGAISGALHLPDDLLLTTSIALPPTDVSKFTRPLCISDARVPPAKVEARFPRVEITTDSVDPTGQIRAELFGGVIEADNIGFFDLDSEVPEVDFSATMRGVRLEKIGEWLNFGEMRGYLEGHAQDVVFQSWLPTQFDARIEVKPPADRARVVFSPVAVQNFVEVVADSKLENVPGIVKWYAFGTPRYIFGGYDIDYAGVKLSSNDGIIELETLDPPEIYKKEKKHFILYGASVLDRVPVLGAVAWGGFRVPIQSPRYPVVMDAAAIANYIRQLTERLRALSDKNKEAEESDENNPNEVPSECEPKEIPSFS